MPMSNQANGNEKENEENALPKPLPWGNRIHGTSRLPLEIITPGSCALRIVLCCDIVGVCAPSFIPCM